MKISQHIFLATLAALAASCSSDNLPETLSGNGEKTPITIAASISDGTPLSRANGKTFASGDKLIARLRQVTWNGTSTDYISGVSQVAADQSPRTVTFTVNSNNMTVVNDRTQQTGDLTPDAPLYWDDFSKSDDADHDIRTTGHYLQSAWGFCYNGNTQTTSLDETNGTITWTATGNFDSQSTFTKNDLLWSAAQRPISYSHADGDRGTLVIPYTHAMSMITIEVVAADGFTTGNLGSTTATLQAMYKSATFSAPNATVSDQTGSQNVAMLAGTEGTNSESKPNKVFQALVIPGKELTTGNDLAVISDIDGNNYKIPVTDAILMAWNSHLVGRKLKSGINYKLTVTVAKQAIDIVAQITNWVNIEAAGTGEINFSADVTSSGVANTATGSFDLYRSTETDGTSSLAYATTSDYSDSKWVNNPPIYWANGTTSYYFRALATLEADGKLKSRSTTVGVEGENARTAAAQGKDLMWATTKAHNGTAADGSSYSYDAGAAIRPRTGDVPLQFEHAMSKITINLSTSTTGKDEATQSLDDKARAVDFTGAKISISNLCTAGTIAIANGNITPTALSVEAPTSLQQNVTTETGIKDKGSISEIVIPQSLLEKTIDGTDNCPIKLTITLGDGTTYSLLLKDCKVKDSADNYITTWQRGTHYVYEIYVEKEAIRFVAVIKEWEKVNGSGDANLDWD